MLKFDDRLKLESEAHDFVIAFCDAKNIELTLRQKGRTGHCEIAEIWTFPSPIPVTASEIKYLESYSVIDVIAVTDENGKTVLTKISRGAGWVVYELESGQTYFNE